MGYSNIPLLSQQVVEMANLALVVILRLHKAVDLTCSDNPLYLIQERRTKNVRQVWVLFHLLDRPRCLAAPTMGINNGDIGATVYKTLV